MNITYPNLEPLHIRICWKIMQATYIGLISYRLSDPRSEHLFSTIVFKAT